MADEMIALFVEYVEAGRWSDVPIIVSIPGGVFAGELISARQFLEECEERTVFHRLAELTGEFDESPGLKEPPASQGASPVAAPDYLHMRNAVLLSAPPPRGKPKHIRLLRVRLEAVSAWSIGRSAEE